MKRQLEGNKNLSISRQRLLYLRIMSILIWWIQAESWRQVCSFIKKTHSTLLLLIESQVISILSFYSNWKIRISDFDKSHIISRQIKWGIILGTSWTKIVPFSINQVSNQNLPKDHSSSPVRKKQQSRNAKRPSSNQPQETFKNCPPRVKKATRQNVTSRRKLVIST